MGNSQKKGIPVAVLKDPDYKVFDQKDYNKFFQDPDHIMCSLYDDFDQFIEKQSLKNLHHIIIIEEHKQYIQKYQKDEQQNKLLPQYMRPIDSLINKRNKAKIRTRDKVINYIKKYSLDDINLYIYVKQFKSFIIPEYQVPYVTLVSTTSQIIINHVLNQTTQNMASVKFKSLVRDLYRKKLVVVISKYWPKKDKQSKKDIDKKIAKKQESKQSKQKQIQILKTLKTMQQEFKQNNFQYLFVNQTQQLSDKLKSMYFQFMICVDQQELLQIIQFKKKMPIQSKLIYFGTKIDLGVQQSSKTEIDKILLQKKLKQIWWISNDLSNEIIPVMRKWWNAKTQSTKSSKTAQNVVIFVTKCLNIIQKKYIKKQLQSKLASKNKENQQKSQPINITIQHKFENIKQRLKNDLYTIVIMFDTSYQEFQEMKNSIMQKIKGEPRVQLSLLELQQKDKQNKSFKELLDLRIKECSNKKYYEFKQQVSPIEKINCINLTRDVHEYFSYKMGLEVKIFTPQINQDSNQKKKIKFLEDYFPKIIKTKPTQLSSPLQQNILQNPPGQTVFQLRSTFQNFYIVCSFDDYLKFLFPYLVLAHFYNKKQNTFQLPSDYHYKKIMDYLKRIKVIIYSEVEYPKDHQQKISLKQLLRLHQNPAQAQKYIKKAIYDFLEFSQKTNQNKKQKQRSQQQQKKQLALKKLFQYIEMSINNLESHDLIENLMQFGKKTKSTVTKPHISFPNIEFIHFKLSQIESYLKLCRYNKLSQSFFTKGSLKNFYKAKKQIQNILTSKSFVIDANFGSNNDQLKKIFQKNVQDSSTHKMEFVKISKFIEQDKFQNFIRKYSDLWKLSFEVMKQNPQKPAYWSFNEKALQMLKSGIIRAFKRSKNYELIKVSTSQFKTFYIDRIQNCKNLLDLQIAVIYIYSLPHGISDIIAAIFEAKSRSSLSLQIYIEFLFVLFLNFFSFNSRKLERLQTIIYADEKQMKNLYDFVKIDEIVFNQNILQLVNNQNIGQNKNNHCIVIEYQNIPYLKKSSLSALLQVQELSFYKESAQYLLAPYTKLRLKNKEIIDGKCWLYFSVVHDHESNLFLKSLFQLNKISDIGIFQALQTDHHKNQIFRELDKYKINQNNKDQEEDSELQSHKNKMLRNEKITQTNKRLDLMKDSKKKTKIKTSKVEIQQLQKQQKKIVSLYRHAQQIGLMEQKNNVKFSIMLNITFMKMLSCINKNRLFSADKYMQLLQTTSETQWENNTGEKKKFQLVMQAVQMEKLSIYQAIIYAKRHQFNKAINELNLFLQFMQQENIQDNGNWIKMKIIQLIDQISRMREQRHQIIKIIEKQNKILQKRTNNIDQKNTFMLNTSQKEQLALKEQRSKKMPKWKVSFNLQNETFIMSKLNNKNDSNIKQSNDLKKQKSQQEQQIYDLYCKKLFHSYEEKITKNFTPSYNKIMSTINIKDIVKTIANKTVEQIQDESNPIKSQINKTALGEFYKQLRPQFDIIKLLHVYLLFHSKLLMQNNQKPAKIKKRLNEKQRYQYKIQNELIEKLLKVPSSFILQKFSQWALRKYQILQKQDQQTDFNIQKQQADQTEENYKNLWQSNGFLYCLKQIISTKDFSQMRQPIISQYQSYQKTIKQNKERSNKNKKYSWIDIQLMAQNRQSVIKWSAFEFDNKMIVVDANRKWKQKMESIKKQSSKIFYRAENEVIQNQNAKRQQQNRN